jgi:2-polyprenyl-3-methyl-5-hydroxy-6-metoxy-1,4-benzoquinol methylase
VNEDSAANYLEVNRRNWDERAAVHAASPSYQFDRLLGDPHHLSEVVAFDLPRLGRLDGLDVLHLQCHIGTDTVSLARLGARSVTGLDLSPASLAEARRLAERCAVGIEFVESEVYGAVDALGGRTFDLVYTGIGALNWLPSIERWAGVVSTLLHPGGRLFIRDGHPMMYTLPILDEYEDLRIELPYFETAEPIVSDSDTTYVTSDVRLVNTTNVEWNHGLGEMVTALLDHGMELTALVEHRSVPWEAIPGLMEPIGGGEYALRDGLDRLPLSFTLQARKR